MKTGIFVALWAVLSAFPLAAQADTMRCGNRLVATGDSTSKVLRLCGKPAYKNKARSEKRTVEQTTSEGTTIATVTVRVERWSYDQGSGRLLKILVFRDGILDAVEDGERM